MTKTRNAMEKLQDALEEAIDRRIENFDNRSEEWRASDAGVMYQETNRLLEEMLDTLGDWMWEIDQ